MPSSNTPIQRQLMTMLMVISGLVLLTTSAALLAYEFVTYRQSAVGQLSTLGRIVASNSTAALAFANPDDARETLSALRAEPDILGATLYDASGQPFASYPEGRPVDNATPGPDGYRFEEGRLVGFEPVIEGDNDRLGTLYILRDMGALYDRLSLYAGIVAIVMGVSLLIAYLLSGRLQRQISQPILALAEVATAISVRQDFSVRAPRRGGAELGTLTDAFNHMLERIQAQREALQESEQSLATTLDSIADAVIATDTEGRILRMNPVAEQLTGWAMAESEGQPITEVFRAIHEETGEPAESPVRHVLRDGVVVGTSNHTALTSRDGQTRPIAHSGAPIRDAQGSVRGVVLVFRDQTEEREAQRMLLRSLQLEAQNLHMQEANRLKTEYLEKAVSQNRELEQALRALEEAQEELARKERLAVLGRLSGSVGHELRNPLGVMTNAVYFLTLVLKDPPEKVTEYLGILRHQIMLSEKIVGDLLDFARIKAPQRAVVDLRKLIDDQLARVTVPANVRVETRFPESTPKVEIDAIQIGQVVLNLITNAVQAMETSGGALTITAEPRDGSVRVAVEDSGTGVAEELRAKIFEPLFTTKARGIGLGLAVSRSLAQANGGELALGRGKGPGARFELDLPVTPGSG
jgi:PAS domain S-box-containing protein